MPRDVNPRTRRYSETKPVEQFPGVVRRTFVSGANLTLVEITLSPGAEVPAHTHPHEQAGTVDAGRILLRMGDRDHELGPGDSYLIPGGLAHYVRAHDAARLVEVFSPVREEFAND
ncbi:MAG: cupin domain-containing protein [Chloroflexi bacterium]|nr:cupin domain-containing protein [Chloroflexota bacterium]